MPTNMLPMMLTLLFGNVLRLMELLISLPTIKHMIDVGLIQMKRCSSQLLSLRLPGIKNVCLTLDFTL
jgi:hypothetical protein